MTQAPDPDPGSFAHESQSQTREPSGEERRFFWGGGVVVLSLGGTFVIVKQEPYTTLPFYVSITKINYY